MEQSLHQNHHSELQYLHLIDKIIKKGHKEETRNGTTLSLFGESMRFSLQNQQLPLFTTKQVAWKTCLKELLWFIRGSTDNEELTKQKVHIWDANASRSFLDLQGLTMRQENDLGPIYGHQWRYFNAPYVDCHTDYSNQGIDQLQYVIDQLKNPKSRTSRRIILSAWNPCQIQEMALPPCHTMCQFNVHDGNQLSCALYQRSGDLGLGVPFNVLSYSLLTHLLAKHCGLEAYEFVHFLGNVHIYDDHIEPLRTQLQRTPYEFPKVQILNLREKIEDYSFSDFSVENYQYHEKIEMKMRE